MIDPKAAFAVRTLAQHRSFRVAAEVTGTSPSSFSRHVRQAEDFAGQTLFERTGKSVAPTPAGRLFLAMLDSLQEAIGQFEASTERLRHAGPDVINIGCGPLAARSIISPLLSEAIEKHPEVRAKVKVTSSKEPLEALRTGALDLVVCDLTHTHDLSELEIQLLRKRRTSYWARPKHPIHEHPKTSLKEVFSYPFATGYLPSFWRKQIVQMLGGTQSAIAIAQRVPHIESDDFSLLASIASKSDLICGGVDEDFENYARLGLLKEIKTQEVMTWNICMARRANTSFPMLDAFWSQICCEHIQE